MARSASRVCWVIGLVVLELTVPGLAWSGRAEASQSAQAAETTLQIPLYTDFIGIRTTLPGTPRVRLLDAAGVLRAEVSAAGPRPVNGQWFVSLSQPGQNVATVLIQPGDRVEVTLDGRLTALAVPAMSASVDAETEFVTGEVPPGTAAVAVAAHIGEGWTDPTTEPQPMFTPVDARGHFELGFAGSFDFRPGTWGQVLMADSAGHVTVVPFSPPSVIVYPAAHVAVIQCDPTTDPHLRVTNPLGADLFRSTQHLSPSFSLIPRFLVPLVHEGEPIAPFDLLPGQEVVLTLHDQPVLTATMPWMTATIDPAGRAVTGFAPPEARTVVSVQPQTSQAGATVPPVTAVTRSDARGRYQVTLAGTMLDASAQATAITYPDGAAAFATQGLVPSQSVLLYGDALEGVIAGWGEVAVEHRAADGALVARTSVHADAVGRITARLVQPGGLRATIAPGDRLVITPEKGEPMAITVPRVSATVDAARRLLQGEAPADVRLVTAVYSQPPDYFAPRPYDQPYLTLEGRSDATGHYRIPCTADTCAMRYGVLVAYEGSTGFVLQWLDAPLVGVAVTLNNLLGRATAGTRVTITQLGASGQPGSSISDIVRPLTPGAFPEWEAGLDALFPHGLQPGDRLRIDVGEGVVDVRVPALTWQADVARNEVAGTGPAGRVVVAIAVPYGDAARPVNGTAQTIVGLDGRWRARFGGFNLKPGDDLYLLMPAENHYLYWIEESVQGEEPAEPTPAPTPARAAIYLPSLMRDASVVAHP